MLLVTHETSFVPDAAPVVVFLHDGQIEEQGKPYPAVA